MGAKGKGAGKKGAKGSVYLVGKGAPVLECHRCGEPHFARDCPNLDLREAGQGDGHRSVYKGGAKG